MVMMATNATANAKTITAHPGIWRLVLMQYISQNPVFTTTHNDSASYHSWNLHVQYLVSPEVPNFGGGNNNSIFSIAHPVADTHLPPSVIIPLFYSGIIGLLFIGEKIDSRD
jgi:hypothetical protein